LPYFKINIYVKNHITKKFIHNPFITWATSEELDSIYYVNLIPTLNAIIIFTDPCKQTTQPTSKRHVTCAVRRNKNTESSSKFFRFIPEYFSY